MGVKGECKMFYNSNNNKMSSKEVIIYIFKNGSPVNTDVTATGLDLRIRNLQSLIVENMCAEERAGDMDY